MDKTDPRRHIRRMLWVDLKYANILCPRQRNFKRRDTYLLNFSCPFCGDSRKRRNAARGYVYRKGDQLNYDCKRCHKGVSLKNFVRELDPLLYEEMTLDYLRERESAQPPPPIKEKLTRPEPGTFNPYEGLTKLTDLPKNHMVRQYVDARNIPLFQQDDLYYTDQFYIWSSIILPGRYKPPADKRDDEPRLIIPFRNRAGLVTGFQGRQLVGENTGKKYVYVSFTTDEPLIWGLDKINPREPIYVFEGPIDAMFIPNAIACGGSSLPQDVSRIKDIPKENFVIVYDNEPRKPHTVSKIDKAIKNGYQVCIWPDIEGKDVNEMVNKKISFGLESAIRHVYQKIKEGTRVNIAATLALSTWKK